MDTRHLYTKQVKAIATASLGYLEGGEPTESALEGLDDLVAFAKQPSVDNDDYRLARLRAGELAHEAITAAKVPAGGLTALYALYPEPTSLSRIILLGVEGISSGKSVKQSQDQAMEALRLGGLIDKSSGRALMTSRFLKEPFNEWDADFASALVLNLIEGEHLLHDNTTRQGIPTFVFKVLGKLADVGYYQRVFDFLKHPDLVAMSAGIMSMGVLNDPGLDPVWYPFVRFFDDVHDETLSALKTLEPDTFHAMLTDDSIKQLLRSHFTRVGHKPIKTPYRDIHDRNSLLTYTVLAAEANALSPERLKDAQSMFSELTGGEDLLQALSQFDAMQSAADTVREGIESFDLHDLGSGLPDDRQARCLGSTLRLCEIVYPDTAFFESDDKRSDFCALYAMSTGKLFELPVTEHTTRAWLTCACPVEIEDLLSQMIEHSSSLPSVLATVDVKIARQVVDVNPENPFLRTVNWTQAEIKHELLGVDLGI